MNALHDAFEFFSILSQLVARESTILGGQPFTFAASMYCRVIVCA